MLSIERKTRLSTRRFYRRRSSSVIIACPKLTISVAALGVNSFARVPVRRPSND